MKDKDKQLAMVDLEADPFGIDQETSFAAQFEDNRGSVVAPPQAPQAGAPIEREFDLGNGNIITISGATEQEVYERALEEQRRYDMQNYLLNDSNRFEIPPPTLPEPIPEPTPDDIAAIMMEFPRNPIKAVRDALPWAVGMSAERLQQINERLIQAEYENYGQQIGQAFIQQHPEFYSCPENAAMLLRYLDSQGKDPSLENYNWAYEKIQPILFTEPTSDDAAAQSSQTPTGLSGDLNAVPSGSNKGYDKEDFNRWMMTAPIDEIDAWARPRRRYS